MQNSINLALSQATIALTQHQPKQAPVEQTLASTLQQLIQNLLNASKDLIDNFDKKMKEDILRADSDYQVSV